MDEETALLIAARDVTRQALGLKENECDVDLDDLVPAITGTRYALITPAGIQTGPRARSSTAVDRLLSLRVTVFHRIASMPKDRRRNVFLDLNQGLNADLQKVLNAIDFSYVITTKANNLLQLQPGEGFVEPLRFGTIDPKPQTVNHDAYDAYSEPTKGSHPILGVKRGVTFSLARFMRTVRA